MHSFQILPARHTYAPTPTADPLPSRGVSCEGESGSAAAASAPSASASSGISENAARQPPCNKCTHNMSTKVS